MTLETILENGVGLREELEEEDKKNFPFHIQALERYPVSHLKIYTFVIFQHD